VISTKTVGGVILICGVVGTFICCCYAPDLPQEKSWIRLLIFSIMCSTRGVLKYSWVSKHSSCLSLFGPYIFCLGAISAPIGLLLSFLSEYNILLPSLEPLVGLFIGLGYIGLTIYNILRFIPVLANNKNGRDLRKYMAGYWVLVCNPVLFFLYNPPLFIGIIFCAHSIGIVYKIYGGKNRFVNKFLLITSFFLLFWLVLKLALFSFFIGGGFLIFSIGYFDIGICLGIPDEELSSLLTNRKSTNILIGKGYYLRCLLEKFSPTIHAADKDIRSAHINEGDNIVQDNETVEDNNTVEGNNATQDNTPHTQDNATQTQQGNNITQQHSFLQRTLLSRLQYNLGQSWSQF
jgi:hypothetical protein